MESAQQKLSPKQPDAGRRMTVCLNHRATAQPFLTARNPPGRACHLVKDSTVLMHLTSACSFKKTFTVVEDGVRRAATGVDSRFDVSGKAAKAARG